MSKIDEIQKRQEAWGKRPDLGRWSDDDSEQSSRSTRRTG